MIIKLLSRWIVACVLALTLWMIMGLTAHAVTQEDADAKFAEENWESSSVAYETLLKSDPENAANWFRLATALDNLEQYDRAQKAYESSLDKNFQTPVRIHYRLARLHMKQARPEIALVHLRSLGELGGMNFRVIENTTEFAPLAEDARFKAVIDALRPCQGAGYRDFDFWLGEWDVTSAGNSQPTASNRITVEHDGCILREDYVNGYFTGMSLSFYDSRQEKWHQTWMSNAGGALYIEGGLNDDGAMVLSNADLPISKINAAISRVTWTPLETGAIRQHWESSTDDGKTWSTVFDGTYTRKQKTDD